MEQFGQYFSFKGTATRSEYWVMLGVSFLPILSIMTMLAGDSAPSPFLLLMALAASIASLWYNAATTVRRINDTGMSIWWIITLVLPYVGPAFIFVFGCLPSEEKT